MRVLHVETGRHFYGGPQQVAYLVRGLAASGVDNLLVCPPASGIEAPARAAGARVLPLPCAGDLDLRFCWRLGRVLREERPDLLHCHSRRGADFLGGAAARLAGIPAVLSRRVDHAESALIARWRYRAFRKVVAISATVAEALRASGLDEERLEVIPSAVDARAFAKETASGALDGRFGIGAGDVAIAVVAQLIPRKGHRYLLDAFARVLTECPAARLVVFGKGPGERALRRQAATLGITERLCFAGFIDDLDRLLGGFDLVVHPALREGLGVAMLKAAAAGKAVVAFDAAGSREAVVHGETGLLVAPGDTEALARAIVDLARDRNRRDRLGAAGRARVGRTFSVDAMVASHLRLYQGLLGQPWSGDAALR